MATLCYAPVEHESLAVDQPARRQDRRGARCVRARLSHEGGLRDVHPAPDEEAADAIAVGSYESIAMPY